jgi:hypothetical protein
MKNVSRRLSLTVVSFGLLTATVLPGCYKTEMETQKARADKAEGDLAAAKEQLTKSKAELDSAKAQINQSRSGQLVTLVNGQQAGTDQITMTQPGVFVRNGIRQRVGSKVNFDNGRIADQQLVTTRPDGKTNFQGNVKNSRPEGDWLWYDPKGNPATKEVWKDGKLAQVFRATAVKGDQITWKEMSKAEREAWFKSTGGVFSNLPELIRELDAAPAPAPKDPKADPKATDPKAKAPAKTPAKR